MSIYNDSTVVRGELETSHSSLSVKRFNYQEL